MEGAAHNINVSDLPLLQDATEEELSKAVTDFDWKALREAHADVLGQQLRRERAPPEGLIGPIEATEYLKSCLTVAEKLIVTQISAYSAHRWLWYLRRSPDFLFAGRYATTQGYDRSLVETLSGSLGTQDLASHSRGFVRYPINTSIARHLVRFVASVRVLSQLHVSLRYAGKGATFRFTGSPHRPAYEVPPELEKAI